MLASAREGRRRSQGAVSWFWLPGTRIWECHVANAWGKCRDWTPTRLRELPGGEECECTMAAALNRDAALPKPEEQHPDPARAGALPPFAACPSAGLDMGWRPGSPFMYTITTIHTTQAAPAAHTAHAAQEPSVAVPRQPP